MKIRLLYGESGPGINRKAGDIVDLPDEDAVRYLNLKRAEPVEQEKETATSVSSKKKKRSKKA